MEQKERKVRMAEPRGETNHQLQDKGYKKLFEDKEMFLEFIQTFIKEDWVRDIREEDLVRVDKEYILQDYRKKEADIVYRMRFKSPATGEEKEAIFYILLELQSGVERMMPYRLLMYMVQIWKQELTNVKYAEAEGQAYKLPAIIPVVLYNGEKEWDTVMRFRDLLNEPGRFGEYQVDFQYILVSVNSYSEKELLKVANAISCIVMMDQRIVAKDKEVMIRRLNEIVRIQHQLAPEKMRLIIEWLMEVFSKRIPEAEAKRIIEGLKEGKDMNYAIERLFESVEEKGIERGIERGKLEEKIETAKAGLSEGLTVELVKKLTGLDIEIIERLKKEIKH